MSRQRIDPTASSCDMGDGKEGERQPLLKNENVTYSSHGSDAIGRYQGYIVRDNVDSVDGDARPSLTVGRRV